MSVLIGSLESGPAGSGSDVSTASEPSADTLDAIHADGLRLARGRMLPPLAILTLLAPVAIGASRDIALLARVIAFAVAGWAFHETYEWWLIRRQSPLDAWRAEQQEAAEDSAARSENETRLAALWPLVTGGLLILIVVVLTVQVFVVGVANSVPRAGLVKPAVFAGEYWRLLSAVYLHGNSWHWQANAVGLLTFGALIEAYDRRARVALAFLVGAISGSIASTYLSASTSVGASGAVLGLAGYLFVVGAGPASAPSWLRRHLIRVFLGTAVVGIIGYFFIDNAAHVGGAAGGFALGCLVKRVRHRAGWEATLDACGWIAAATLIVGAVFTTGRLLRAW